MPAVWAYSKGAPGKTCDDARLLGGGTQIQYPAGNDKGQGGWDVGLMFNDFTDLADKLQKVGQITRLAINVHGSPGKVDIDSKGTEDDSFTAGQILSRYRAQVTAINRVLAPGAMVLFMGCKAGQDVLGSEFLKEISKQGFPAHKVVAFKTVGITLRQFRGGSFCSEPGMRDSDYNTHADAEPASKAGSAQVEREKETLKLPWASETSPNAKVALDGKIVSGDEPAIPPVDYSADKYIPGTWTVDIGGWKGFFIFSKDKTVSWMTEGQGVRHPGKWAAKGDAVEWSFDDDAPGWVRTFRITGALGSKKEGSATIKGKAGSAGFFTMYKQ